MVEVVNEIIPIDPLRPARGKHGIWQHAGNASRSAWVAVAALEPFVVTHRRGFRRDSIGIMTSCGG